ERWIELDPNSRIGIAILTQAVYRTGDEDRTQTLLEQAENLQVSVADLQLQRNPAGGATVAGELENMNASAGTRVNLAFTFYDRQGNAIGTETTQVAAGAPGTEGNPGGRTPFRVTFTSDQQVDGYSYQIQ